MDKETLEKIQDIIYPYIGGFAKWNPSEITTYGQAMKVAKQILKELGYCKPKGKPPLLRGANEQTTIWMKAQREADIKFYEG